MLSLHTRSIYNMQRLTGHTCTAQHCCLHLPSAGHALEFFCWNYILNLLDIKHYATGKAARQQLWKLARLPVYTRPDQSPTSQSVAPKRLCFNYCRVDSLRST